MKYMGNKSRIVKSILPTMLKNRKEGQYYVELFVGGANMIDKVEGLRIGSDSNKYLIAMWKELQSGWVPKETYTKKEYDYVKKYKDKEPYLTGYIGFNCSYRSKWFGGFVETTLEPSGSTRNYQKEGWRNILAQIEYIKGIEFYHSNYQDLSIPDNSIVYCDPPYANTTEYKDGDFNHKDFFQWCRDKVKENHLVFISEYKAPSDFISIWKRVLKGSLLCTAGKSKKGVEKLFIHKDQYEIIIDTSKPKQKFFIK